MSSTDPNIRVLVITPNFATRGGIQNYCKTILSHVQASVELLFVGAYSEEEKWWVTMPRLIFASLQFLYKILTARFDVIHVNTSLVAKSLLREGALMVIARLTRTPVLVTFHGWSVDLEKRMTGMRLKLFTFTFSRAQKFVVLSQDFKDALRRMGFKQDIIVESTFVDDVVFGNVNESSIPLLNGHVKPFSILFLSRILKQKGVFVVLESYRMLKPKHRNLKLIVAGEGEDLKEAQTFVEQHRLEDVEFSGFVEGEKKKDTFLRADAFVLPTYYGEGMPIAMLEAMMCGLPIISRPVGGIKDFFQQDHMGVLIDGLEPAHYAGAIEHYMLDRQHWNQVRLHNHHYAREKFLASSAAVRLMGIYHSMTKETNQEQL